MSNEKWSVAQIFEMFERVNADCLATKGHEDSFVPITFANADYYAEQMMNLDFSLTEIDAFTAFLQANE